MANKTALFDAHIAAGAMMVEFGGWHMPVNYGSQIEEHMAVRESAGVFDVSHMTIVDVLGQDSRLFLRYLLANDVDKLSMDGKALYSGMLNHQGGVIDDLIVYRMGAGYRVVVNCATREKDLAWMNQVATGFEVIVKEQSNFCMLAIQGPMACDKTISILDSSKADIAKNLTIFQGLPADDWFIGRTGYTGEDGFEILLPQQEASNFWQKLLESGIKPCGLGARDTLRLEAGMNLYGNEMNEEISPWQANMGWTIDLKDQDRNFIGREALLEEKSAGVAMKLVGLVLQGRGVLRGQQKIVFAEGDWGVVTSGTFSPSLKKSIAMARVPQQATENCQVDIRGKLENAKIVNLPFIRHGKALI